MIEEEGMIPEGWIANVAFCVALSFLAAFVLGGLLSKLVNKRTGMLLVCGGAVLGAAFSFWLTTYLGVTDLREIVILLATVSASIGFIFGGRSGVFLAPGPQSLEFILARRISFRAQRSVSGLLVLLGIISIALGVAVMEISTAILFGFKSEIQNKIVGFGSHISVSDRSGDYEASFFKVDTESDFIPKIRNRMDVSSVAPYIYLAGMIQNTGNLEGVVMKGVEKNYDWTFFREHLKSGRLPVFSDTTESKEILISKKLARLLQLKEGDKPLYFYLEDKPRVRKLSISGTYETGLEEFDASTVICDMRLLQRLLQFSENEAMGFEVNLKDLKTLNVTAEEIDELLPIDLSAIPITEKYPEIFDWLEVQHQNVWAIIGLMIGIAVINIITVILITILEQTRTIGLLKALGMRNGNVMGIFLNQAFLFILAGVIAGNLTGLGLVALQDLTGIIQVNQENYFVKVVPVEFVWDRFLIINAGVISVCMVFTLLPALVISRITPLKAIRFE